MESLTLPGMDLGAVLYRIRNSSMRHDLSVSYTYLRDSRACVQIRYNDPVFRHGIPGTIVRCVLEMFPDNLSYIVNDGDAFIEIYCNVSNSSGEDM